MKFISILAEASIFRILIASLFIAAVYRFTMYDTGTGWEAKIATSNTALENINAKIKKADKELDDIRTLREAQDKDSERLGTLLNYIPERLTKIQLLQMISNEAKSVGVSLNSLRDTGNQQNKGEFYEQIGVSVDLGGTFAQFMLFLSNLTKLNQIVTLETLNLRSASSADSDAMSLSAVIRGYRYVAQTAPPKK